MTFGSAEPDPLERYNLPEDATENIRELFARYGGSYRWLVVFTIMLGSIASLLTATIINVAIPEVMGAFGIGQDKAQWLATAFLASNTVAMLLGPWMIRALGMRQTYILSTALFTLSCVMGGMAVNADSLIFARVVQGASSGLIAPLSMVIMFQIFPVNRRGTAMGIFGVGVVLAPAWGPSLGGVLIDNFSWRYVFFMPAPLCLLSLPLAAAFLPPRDESGPRPSFDWTGLGLLSLFILCLLVALSNGQADGWTSNEILSYFLVAGVSGAAFVYWEHRYSEPILDLRLFTNAGFVASAIVTLVSGAGLYGSTYLVPLFLQSVQGLTATSSGLLLMPGGMMMAAVFLIAGMLSDHISSRFLIISGTLIFVWSSYLMGGVDVNTPFWTLAIWIVIGRLGMGMMMPSMNRVALTALPFALLAQGASVINFLRQLGGAFGVNGLSILLQRQTAVYADAFRVEQTAGSFATMDMLRGVQEMLGQAAAASEAFFYSPAALAFLSRAINQQAAVLAYRDGFLVVGLLFLISVVPAWYMPRIDPETGEALEPARFRSRTQFASAERSTTALAKST